MCVCSWKGTPTRHLIRWLRGSDSKRKSVESRLPGRGPPTELDICSRRACGTETHGNRYLSAVLGAKPGTRDGPSDRAAQFLCERYTGYREPGRHPAAFNVELPTQPPDKGKVEPARQVRNVRLGFLRTRTTLVRAISSAQERAAGRSVGDCGPARGSPAGSDSCRLQTLATRLRRTVEPPGARAAARAHRHARNPHR